MNENEEWKALKEFGGNGKLTLVRKMSDQGRKRSPREQHPLLLAVVRIHRPGLLMRLHVLRQVSTAICDDDGLNALLPCAHRRLSGGHPMRVGGHVVAAGAQGRSRENCLQETAGGMYRLYRQ